jgi:hypothetical protein
VQNFEQAIYYKQQAKNSLKVSEIQEFLLDENKQLKYQLGLFIDPEEPHQNFLKRPSDNKVIKIDSRTTNFNPFSDDFSRIVQGNEDFKTADSRQREEGFHYVREALKKAFPEAGLTEAEINEICSRFDAKFKVATDSPLLTLEALHHFIDEQRGLLNRRSYWERHISRHFDSNTAIRNMFNGIFYSLGTHLGTAILAIPSLYYLWNYFWTYYNTILVN